MTVQVEWENKDRSRSSGIKTEVSEIYNRAGNEGIYLVEWISSNLG